ncbi:MAG: hypothetical protein JJT75_14610 [Opitutales bacterium]|nr:hypothetical protein [Opitutales bacterium]MCH8540064.1 hypothetical protein [Opitutales bacterium]
MDTGTIFANIPLTQQFEAPGPATTIQIFNLLVIVVYIYFAVKAIGRVSRQGKGIEVPIWILVIAFVPVFGILGALLHFPKQPKS